MLPLMNFCIKDMLKLKFGNDFINISQRSAGLDQSP